MDQFTLAEHLLYSTFKIVSTCEGTKTSGTAFFYTLTLDSGQRCTLIVTNKHVIKGFDQLSATLHVGKNGRPSGTFCSFNLDLKKTPVLYHPDESVDLCAISFAGMERSMAARGELAFYITFASELIPKQQQWEEFDAIEEVLMIGCPNGISDEANNFPIARRGITASRLGRPFNGKGEFLIDLACFPGSSGSPILIYNHGTYFDKRKNAFTVGTRAFLVGVLYSGPTITNDGEINLTSSLSFQVSSMMHLGFAIRADQLLLLEKLCRVVASRIDNPMT